MSRLADCLTEDELLECPDSFKEKLEELVMFYSVETEEDELVHLEKAKVLGG